MNSLSFEKQRKIIVFVLIVIAAWSVVAGLR